MSAVFREFLDHYKTVLQFADAKIGVLNTRFDGDVYEKNIEQIADTYIKEYKDSQLDCSVEQRLADNYYHSVYRLYHDIKIASMTKLLNESKLGSEMYAEIDSFYKFAVELLLQESYRLHLKINEQYASGNETRNSQPDNAEERESDKQTDDKISPDAQSDDVDNSVVLENQKAEAFETESKNGTGTDNITKDDDVEMNTENESDVQNNNNINGLQKGSESVVKASVANVVEASGSDNLSSLAKSLSEDYDKILTSFKCKNNFAIIIPNANEETSSSPLSLFSSLINKSELDINDYKIPEPFNSLTILPQTTNTPSTSFKFISNTNPLNNSSLTGNNKIPNATGAPPIEIMRPIFHPNWFSLPSIPWLDFKSSTGFIPLIDETLSVISLKNKNKIYYEQIGLKNLQKAAADIKNRLNDKETQEHENIISENKEVEYSKPKVEQKEPSSKDTEEKIVKSETAQTEDEKVNEKSSEEPLNPENKEDKEDMSANEKTNKDEESKDITTIEKPGVLPINVQNILEWKNGNVFEEDELAAFKQGKEQHLLSKILIDLNKLRSQRHTSTSKVTKPCDTERKLYFKSKRILEIIVHKLKPSDLVDNNIEEVDTITKFKDAEFEDNGIRLSHSIPVLATNYSGTLPIPFAASNSNMGRNKIGSSTRSHKKRK